MDDVLVLGPLLRYVDETTAAIWVEVRRAGRVAVRAAGREWSAATFAAHAHHYALVQVDGLEPGSVQTYTVEVDGFEVWPPAGGSLPPSRIATLRPDQELRLAFGSCRISLPHDEQSNREHGVDALRAYARHMASNDADRWPDLLLFLGDQVYADETSEEMCTFIERRRGLDEPPGAEIKDFEEYTYLYALAWTEPTNRWLLSTLPSAMIFDDHDIRDDWNTSAQWRRDMARLPWWPARISGGLASYWIYQHLGNLSPAARAKDEIWTQIVAGQETGEPRDWGDVLDAFATRVDEHPETYQWSFARDIGPNRLVVVDSRSARVLEPSKRSILDDGEMSWLDEQLRGDFNHVLVGTSLPLLLAKGLHHFEAWSEAVSSGAWGKRAAVVGEKIRRAVDLEHWAAFYEGFQRLSAMVLELAAGERGKPPGSVAFLSGDVHHSYIAEVALDGDTRIVQAVCSPIRNQLGRADAAFLRLLGHGFLSRISRFGARRAGVDEPVIAWDVTHGPWFDNNLATLQTDGRSMTLRWEAGMASGSGDGRGAAAESSELTVVAEFAISER